MDKRNAPKTGDFGYSVRHPGQILRCRPLMPFSDGDGTDDYSLTITGTLEDLNAVLEGLVFTPESDFSFGLLYLSSNDLGNTGSGGVRTAYDTVEITSTL